MMAPYLVELCICMIGLMLLPASSGSWSGVPPINDSQCTPLSTEHPCHTLPDRGTNYTLPETLPMRIVLGDIEARVAFSIVLSKRGSFPDICLDFVERFFCLLGTPPCDPNCDGLPMLVCEQDCATVNVLKADGRCNDTILYTRTIAETTQNGDFIKVLEILERFINDCNDSSTYSFFESDHYADTCTRVFLDRPTANLSSEVPNRNDTDPETMGKPPVVAISTLPVVSAVVSGLFLVTTVCITILVIICIYRRAKRKRNYHHWKRTKEVENRDEFGKQYENEISLTFEEREEARLSVADVESYEARFSESVIQYSCLQLSTCIGEGAFGKVFSGKINDLSRGMVDVDVAIKTIKNIHSREQLTAFLAESLIMKDFNHPHILGLLGVCFNAPDGSPYIILPFMANGSVKTYLKEKRLHVLDVHSFPKDLPLEVLVQMCIDIAEGMKYLAEKRFVHRDLAARNCMVNSNLSVLVGDFGLARDVYCMDYYRARKGARLPVKWMPPETLTDGISNEKTDVWSYGVTCWEVFSLGCTPYPGIENYKILDHISTGDRLKKPTLCPDKLYDIVSECWQYLPENRPTFTEMLSSLKQYWDDEHFYVVQNLT